METLAWFTTFLVVVAAALILIVAAVLLPRTMRTLKASFYCPWRQRRVTVRFLTYDGRHRVGVVSCTAFADPIVITCGAPCVAAEGRPEVAAGEPEAANLPRD